jgi:hypothetical protein
MISFGVAFQARAIYILFSESASKTMWLPLFADAGKACASRAEAQPAPP